MYGILKTTCKSRVGVGRLSFQERGTDMDRVRDSQ